jgi:hypothetical protein
VDAINARKSPSAPAVDRHGLASIRIALRQLKAQGHASATLTAWLAEYDQANLHDGNDEAALGHG